MEDKGGQGGFSRLLQTEYDIRRIDFPIVLGQLICESVPNKRKQHFAQPNPDNCPPESRNNPS